ncbi:MAG: MBL fold metallo-hydrolase [Deltaproteobacteria bacterium]|nr:MBL fold metallo-hydrolase [Deltaproteobacteria bacterium]
MHEAGEKGGLVRIAEDIHVQVGPRGESNQGIITTDAGAVLIDNYVRYYTPLMESLGKLRQSFIRFVVNTHNDMDHFSANFFFRRRGATILSSEWSRAQIGRMMREPYWVEELKKRNPDLAHEVTRPEELIPHLGIHDRASLDLDGETAELSYMGHGHSPGDLTVYLQQRRVLFAGDLVFVRQHGRLKTADIQGLLNILNKLAGMPITAIVPGHGEPVVGSEASEAVAIYRDYISILQCRVSDMFNNGRTLDAIKADFKGWKYESWGRSHLFPVCLEHVYKDVVWRSRFS